MIMAGVVVALALTGAAPAGASAAGCPNEAVRKAEPYASQLPDCRAYEQVSPVDKNATDAAGRQGHMQSSLSGESVIYYSVVPFPGTVGSPEFPFYLSARSVAGWSTQGVRPLVEPAAYAEALSDENGETFVEVSAEEGQLLAPGAKAGLHNLYLHDTLTGEYRLVAAGVFGVRLAAATPDGSRVLFSAVLDEGQELAGVSDPKFVPYLFEWDRETGQVSFVGEVGGKVPQEGTVAGSNEGEGYGTYDQNTLSEDGSRIFFSERSESKKVYMREPDENRTVEVSEGEAQWRMATANGSKAFYTEGGNLYEFDADHMTRTPMTVGAASVKGVAGISADGSYVYFVAETVIPGEDEAGAIAGAPNLYVWHEGATTPIKFIATLNSFYDAGDWNGLRVDEESSAAEGYKSSRVAEDGKTLLFSSREKLTSYNNLPASGICDHVPDRCDELYLYNTRTGLVCVSCNPRTERAGKDTFLSQNTIGPSSPVLNTFTTRNLSADGSRVFFQTEEPLLPQANERMNVYEWEREGTGGCAAGEGNNSGGCLYLISSGQSASASYFGDASVNGENVFFFTRQSLVGQDQDNNVDIYDARVGGGLEAQNTPSSSPCEGEGCRGTPTIAPVFGAPSSTTLSGAGNLAPPAESRAVKPKVKPPTRAQRLVRALGACKKQPKKRQVRCEAQARKSYGTKAKKSDRGGRR